MLRRGRSNISLAMIVRDEEASVQGCLGSTSGLFEETIVVDTGSVDRTREVARSFGATVVDFPWCDDFSVARNVAFSKCACDHILWMDADEVLARRARMLLDRLRRRGLDQRTVYIMYQVSNRNDGAFGLADILSPRLFPNHCGISWTGRVYEGVLPSVRSQGLKTKFIDIVITHLGFAQRASLLAKLFRNKKILENEVEGRLGSAPALFKLAVTHTRIGTCAGSRNDVEASRRYLQELLETRCESMDADSEARVYALLAHNEYFLNNIVSAFELCDRARSLHPTDIELIHLEAFLLRKLGLWEEAEARYRLLPRMLEYMHLRDQGDERYLKLVAAKVDAAYHFEEMHKYYEAYVIWADLVRNAAGVFDAVPGWRRAARRVVREAIRNPRSFLDGLRVYRAGVGRQQSSPGTRLDPSPEIRGSRA